MTLSEASVPATNDASQSTDTAPTWKVNLLYDGECPLCLREVNFLRKKDAGRGLVKFTDIADLNYSAEKNGGVDFETFHESGSCNNLVGYLTCWYHHRAGSRLDIQWILASFECL